jgi:protein-tyrosine phosphatase
MGIFSKIFQKNRAVDPLDFSLIGTDVHSHLIPGIDDGAKDLDDSMRLIRRLSDLGYNKIITTPHVMSDFYRNSSETILRGRDLIQQEAKKRGFDVEIEAAAEYYLDEFFEDLLERRDILTFGDNYVLFELAFMWAPDALNRAIFNMQMAGYKPILAHPERYAYWHDQYSKYEDLVAKDVLLQLNINSLTGTYSPQVQKVSRRLIDDGLISFVGTDCHHLGHCDLLQQASTQKHLHDLVASGKLLNKTL